MTKKNKHCPKCKKLIWSDSTYCRKHCLKPTIFRKGTEHPRHNLGIKREFHPSWKGGRVRDVYGYIRVYSGDSRRRYLKEHRVVMEKHLGRKLENFEDVHHLNGNKQDNRIENLIVMTHQEHGRMHALRQHSQ